MADSFFTKLKRRNVFKVGAAYLVLAWVVVQIADTAVPALHLPEWIITAVFFFGAIGFPFALFFAWAFEITPEGIKKESNIAPEDSITADTGQKLNYIIIGLLIFALGYFIYQNHTLSNLDSNQNSTAQASTSITTEGSEPLVNDKKESVITLAVLPFVNMSNDEEQDYFVDGLTEELLNSLTRVKGLKVTGRTSSFEYKDKNIDLREIGKKLSVEYLVEGSVRKSGDDIRITMQLIEAESGSHILSETFTRKLVDVFAIQEEISNQIAAALNVTLVLKDEQYNSALSSLDYLAVEKLVKARGLLGEYAEEPAKKAFDMLVELNKRYPDTPEIIGLMAYATMIHSSTGKILLSTEEEIVLAKETLKLDRKNKYALTVLAVIYDDFPQTYSQAYDTYQDLIRFYPAEAKSYKDMFYFLMQTNRSCEEIKDFLDFVPSGVFEPETQNQYDFVIKHCLTPKLAEKQLATLDNKSVADISLIETSTTARFERSKERVNENPNQRFLTSYYFNLLTLGAKVTATNTLKKIDLSQVSYWSAFSSLASYMYNIKGVKKPFELRPLIEKTFNNGSDIIAAVSLAKQAYFEEKTVELKSYLDNVPEFPLGIETIEYSFGVVILQYYSGEIVLSKETALKLFNDLKEYKSKYPKSYDYWQLNSYSFPLAFYSGNASEAAQVLDKDFSDNFEYWSEGYEYFKFIFSPWKDNPSVIEYLKRINKDQQRMRDKYNLK